MGCVSSAPETPAVEIVIQKPVVNQHKINLDNKFPDTVATEHINISKIGSYHVIHGTKAVINVQQCHIIGYLDDSNTFHNDKSPYVETVCKKFDIEFKK